ARVSVVAVLVMATAGIATAGDKIVWPNHYRKMPLVSDVEIPARTYKDPNLVNPWGLAHSEEGPWWVANNHTGTSTVYKGTGQPEPLVVLVPGDPTGLVYHEGEGFLLPTESDPPAPAEFIFASEDGTISAWNDATISPKGPAAMVVID